MKVIPKKKGLLVFNPATKLHLPDDKPSIVPITTYWRRRLIDGDIKIVVDEPIIDKKESKKIKKNNKEIKTNGGN